jgi:hypothetical protein
MTARQIKAELAKKKIRQVDLAKKWHLPTGTVSQLVNRKMKSERLYKRLAKELGMTFEEFSGMHGAAQ